MPSTGTPLLARADFTLGTGDLHTGGYQPFNPTLPPTVLWPKLFGYRKELAGGERIDWDYMTGGNDSFKAGVLPGETRVPKRKDVVTRALLDYVRHTANAMFTDNDIEYNAEKRTVMMIGNDEQRAEIIFNMYRLAFAKAELDLINGVEQQVGAVPASSTMASSATSVATRIMSFFAHLNEDFKGLYGVITATGIGGGSGGTDFVTSVGTDRFSTKQGLNPNDARFTRVLDGGNMYSPTKETYTTTVADGANKPTNPIAALRTAIWASQYKKPPTIFRDGNFRGVGADEDLMILASKFGLNEVMAGVLLGQDLWVTDDRSDPSVTPHYGRSRVTWWPILDAIAIYTGGTKTTKVTERAATVDDDGPRFYGCRSGSFYPVAHDMNYFRVREMPRHVNVPDLEVQWIDLDCNMKCEDYPAQFVVSPSGNVY
jgi:hypothetical protein